MLTLGEFLKDGQASALDAVKGIALYVGLGRGTVPTDLSDWTGIDEETDANYARQSVTWTANSVDANGKHMTENSAKIDFAGWSADATAPITYAFVTDQLSGETGKLVAVFDLTTSIQPLATQPASVPAGGLDMTLD